MQILDVLKEADPASGYERADFFNEFSDDDLAMIFAHANQKRMQKLNPTLKFDKINDFLKEMGSTTYIQTFQAYKNKMSYYNITPPMRANNWQDIANHFRKMQTNIKGKDIDSIIGKSEELTLDKAVAQVHAIMAKIIVSQRFAKMLDTIKGFVNDADSWKQFTDKYKEKYDSEFICDFDTQTNDETVKKYFARWLRNIGAKYDTTVCGTGGGIKYIDLGDLVTDVDPGKMDKTAAQDYLQKLIQAYMQKDQKNTAKVLLFTDETNPASIRYKIFQTFLQKISDQADDTGITKKEIDVSFKALMLQADVILK